MRQNILHVAIGWPCRFDDKFVAGGPEDVWVTKSFSEVMLAMSFVANRVETFIAASITNSLTEAL
jgi:hypothetical protein